MSKVRIIVNALLVISGAFLCAESGLDSPMSQLDVPIAKKAKKLDRAMLLTCQSNGRIKNCDFRIKRNKGAISTTAPLPV